MLATLERYFLLFFLVSVLGWCMEVICKYIQFRRFINRGFLIGPYCPIYGTGAVLIVRLLSRYAGEPVTVFFMGILVCGVLEYVTSYLMEKLFHARWWDYSDRRFHINGRVCANTLIPFGMLGLVLIYGIQPLVSDLFDLIPSTLMHVLCAGLLLILLTDATVSASILGKIRESATQLTGADDTETLTRIVRERLSERGVLIRRALRAFPYMKVYNSHVLQQMREGQQKLRQEAEEKNRKLREEFEMFEARLRERRSGK